MIYGLSSTDKVITDPKEILKNYLETCLRIPMNKNIRALNLSNCVAIMLYEVLRQQDYRDLLKQEPFKGENYLED
jgi:tRNA (cytidine/uridine-2'-O-)-methyltransferase